MFYFVTKEHDSHFFIPVVAMKAWRFLIYIFLFRIPLTLKNIGAKASMGFQILPRS